MSKIKKTCRNCEYGMEEYLGTHCFDCIYNGGDNFKPKATYEAEIRKKAIDEFVEALRLECLNSVYKEVSLYNVLKIAEQMKAGE